MNDEPPRSTPAWLPALVLVALLGLALAGWFLFPHFAAYMNRQDCIAAGHTNCG